MEKKHLSKRITCGCIDGGNILDKKCGEPIVKKMIMTKITTKPRKGLLYFTKHMLF
jgi:hypothetical protein